MEPVFDCMGTRAYRQGKHTGFIVPWKRLAPFTRHKWAGNRDVDPARVEDMLAYFRGGGFILPVICLAELDGNVVCYDGLHRSAMLAQANPDDLVCLADVMFAATNADVAEAFEAVNRSVSVPALFTEGAIPPATKDELVAVAARLCKLHPAFVSPSAKCRAPNFNRDRLVDNLSEVFDDLGGQVTVAELERMLEALDLARSQGRCCRPHESYPPAVTKKCREGRFWLFLEARISAADLRAAVAPPPSPVAAVAAAAPPPAAVSAPVAARLPSPQRAAASRPQSPLRAASRSAARSTPPPTRQPRARSPSPPPEEVDALIEAESEASDGDFELPEREESPVPQSPRYLSPVRRSAASATQRSTSPVRVRSGAAAADAAPAKNAAGRRLVHGNVDG